MDGQTQQSVPTSKTQTPKQQVVDTLKKANNVLVTISSDPSVDQLAACIGLTLMMNKLGKHATAVFSGAIPSTIDFLNPGQTIEQTTDSLRDFIISLDKSKADKLRYKVEDEVVRIYITPYRTSISDADLVFTQGDFNVDAVVALGIYNKDQLDQAIIEHGQILHDAAVIDLSCGEIRAEMGTINWYEPAASSLSEMLVSISESFQAGLLDDQMATAFLTGIVAETERFSNARTTPKAMTMSAQLMAAGANQQLIATQLAIVPESVEEYGVPEEPVAPVDDTVLHVGGAEEMVSDPALDPDALGQVVVDHSAVEDPAPVAAPDEMSVTQGSPGNALAFSIRDNQPAEGESGASAGDDAESKAESEDSTAVDPQPVSPVPALNGTSQIEIDEHGNMIDLAVEAEERAYTHKRVIQPLNQPPVIPRTDLSTIDAASLPSAELQLPTVVVETPAQQSPEDSPAPELPTEAIASIPNAPPEVSLPVEATAIQFAESATEVLAPETHVAQYVSEQQNNIPEPEVQHDYTNEPQHEPTLQELEVAVDSPHINHVPLATPDHIDPQTDIEYNQPNTDQFSEPPQEPAQSSAPPLPPPFIPTGM
jgi:nanoRNase/pAp phosphatase (c-di-AMP/oligoRNAs hydrolase)